MTKAKNLIAIVTENHGRHFFVTTENGDKLIASRRGKKNDVVVGDCVICSTTQGSELCIDSIAPRKNLLFRSDKWKTKPLASNIDGLAILFASQPSFNPHFIWKALLAAKTAGIRPYVIQTKADLTNENNEADFFLERIASLGEETLKISVKTKSEEAFEKTLPLFKGKKVLLVGQSGMGKSTLINLLCPSANARTQEISLALNLGKQTTTETVTYETVLEGEKSFLIDSPGFQEFGLAHLTKDDILSSMNDIAKYVDGCRFYNCTHTNEPGCSVRLAVEKGLINKERYAFYCSMVAQCATK